LVTLQIFDLHRIVCSYYTIDTTTGVPAWISTKVTAFGEL
jgi:hypothetical protein